MREIANLLLLSAAVWVGCANQPSDSGARFAALEGRIQRLEQLVSQDASADALPDASVEAAVAPDAMRDPMAVRVLGADSGASDPQQQAAQIASCKAEVVNRCTEELLQKRLREQRAQAKGKPTWIQPGPPVAPDSTPEGRACLKREREHCDRMFQKDKLIAWLDSQLEPGKRDDELTNEIRARIAKQAGIGVDQVDVVCAPQFCRFGSGLSERFRVGDGFGNSGVSIPEFSYRMRKGFELAQ